MNQYIIRKLNEVTNGQINSEIVFQLQQLQTITTTQQLQHLNIVLRLLNWKIPRLLRDAVRSWPKRRSHDGRRNPMELILLLFLH